MIANVQDRIVVPGRGADAPSRDGEVLKVYRAEGTPPYLVRWNDDGQESVFFPGPEAVVEHHAR